MVCDQCGLPLLGTETFCPQCGARIGKDETPETPPEAETPAATQAEPEAGQGAEGDLEVDLEPPAAEAPPEGEPDLVETIDIPLEVAEEDRAPEPVEKPRAARRPKESPPVEEPPATRRPKEPPAPRALSRARRLLGVRLVGPLGLGIAAGCLTLFIIALGLLGAYEGLHIRSERQFQEAATHYELGLAHLDKGEYEQAIAEFERALRLRQDYPEAEQKLEEALFGASQKPSPSAPGSQLESSSLLAEGRNAYERGSWEEAIQKLEALQSLDPTYEQATVRRLLAGAYANSGLKLVNEARLEEAIRRFDQALTLEPDNPDVQLQRRLATLYQAGLSAWGVDWNKAIESFSAAYALKPDYRDTSERLLNAYVEAGGAAGSASAWCDAVQYYKAALDLTSDPDIAAKRDDAAHRCASPTTAPGGTPVASGTYVGTFGGLEDIRFRTTKWAKVYGRVVNAAGEGVPSAQVRLSAFDWSSIHTTDATGYYGFEFLNQEITFTVDLVGLAVQPVDVPAKFGYAAIANFEEKK